MTTSNNKQNKIQLAKVISKNLLFRNSADELFNYINNFKVSEIIIDFHKIQSITRSFANQYLINKQKSEKNIIDVNISTYIKNMFELVGRTHKA
jgi:hypothetical protein